MASFAARATSAACRRTDLILAVGSRLGQFTTHFDDRYIAPGTKIIQIDIHGEELGPDAARLRRLPV
jgi:thiamine pyrophosphate-dependent acetolactate synthase large subunit-like protein